MPDRLVLEEDVSGSSSQHRKSASLCEGRDHLFQHRDTSEKRMGMATATTANMAYIHTLFVQHYFSFKS